MKTTDRQPGLLASPASSFRESFCVALGLIVLLTIYFGRVTFGGEALVPADILFTDPVWQSVKPIDFVAPQNPLMSDYIWNYYPVQILTQRELQNGRLLLWNPYIYSGTAALAAAQWSILDPINLLLLRILPVQSVPGWNAFLRLLIAGLGLYALLRSWKLSPAASFISVVSFIWGGATILDLSYPIVDAAAWLPLLMLLAERNVSSPRPWRSFLLGAMVAALQFVAGDPQGSLYIVLVTFLYGVTCAIRQNFPRRVAIQRVTLFCAMLILGGILASIQLIPFAELVLQSQYLVARVGDVATQPLFYTRFWYDSLKAVTMFLPNLLGNPTQGNLWVGNAILDYTFVLYMGILPLLFAWVGGWQQRKNWRVRFFGSLAILSLGVMFRWPIFDWIARLPFINLSHFTRGFQQVYCFCLAILAGLGFDAILGQSLQPTQRRLRRLLAGFGMTCGLALLAADAAMRQFQSAFLQVGSQFVRDQVYNHPPHPYPLEFYLAQLQERYQQALQVLDLLRLTTYLPILFALGGAVLLWANQKEYLQPRFIRGLLVLLVLADLWTFGWGFNVSIPADQVLRWTPALRFLAAQPGYARVAGLAALPNNTGIPFGLYNYRGADIITARTHLIAEQEIDLVDLTPANSQHNQKLFDLMSVRYFLTSQSLRADDLRLIYDQEIKIYERADALARVYLARSYQVVGDTDTLRTHLSDDAVVAGRQVLLEETPPLAQESPDVSADGRADIRLYEPNQVTIQSSSSQESILVLTDTFYPGWDAFVDGQATRVFRANGLYRAVIVPAGRHVVEFVFRPLAFWAGVWITLATFGVIALSALLLWLNDRRRKPT